MAGALAAVLLIGWAAGVDSQTTSEPTPPPLPPADSQPQQPQQAATPATNAATTSTSSFPTLPLGHDSVREVQSQLIALGFDPGPADGEPGPATIAAAQQYNENRGGSGPVPIDGALLARLQQDTAPRLTPEQVAARSQPRYQAHAPAANPLVGAMQQFDRTIRGLFNGGH
jgi:peptidoglycan hydrolase-like protein with peptidoglycan-binding domain